MTPIPLGTLAGQDLAAAQQNVAAAESAIDGLRTQIDNVDQEILRLLEQRRRLSGQVQQTRVAAGGVRVELQRERQIVQTYRTSLGQPGTALASAVLRTCRGSL